MALFTFSSLLCHAFSVNQLCLLIKKGRMAILIMRLLSFFFIHFIFPFLCAISLLTLCVLCVTVVAMVMHVKDVKSCTVCKYR